MSDTMTRRPLTDRTPPDESPTSAPPPAQRRPLTQGEIEQEIVDLSNQLEAETDKYAAICDEVVGAEADWKFGYYTALVDLTERGEKLSIPVREAKAHLAAGKDLFLIYRLAQERQRASQAYMKTIGQRLEAKRTLAANVRAQT